MHVSPIAYCDPFAYVLVSNSKKCDELFYGSIIVPLKTKIGTCFITWWFWFISSRTVKELVLKFLVSGCILIWLQTADLHQLKICFSSSAKLFYNIYYFQKLLKVAKKNMFFWIIAQYFEKKNCNRHHLRPFVDCILQVVIRKKYKYNFFITSNSVLIHFMC